MPFDTTVNYITNNGLRDFDEGIVYDYECERCMTTRGTGRWTQNFVNKYHGGELSILNEAHKDLCFPYGHLHEVKKIDGT